MTGPADPNGPTPAVPAGPGVPATPTAGGEPEPATGAEARPPHPADPGFLQVLTAPLKLHAPRSAGILMAGSSRWSFWVTYLAYVFALGTAVVSLVVLTEALSAAWISGDQEPDYVRAISRTWQAHHQPGTIWELELTFAGIALGMPMATVLGAWIFLPNIHRGGSGVTSLRTAFRAIAAGIGPLSLATVAAWGVRILTIFARHRGIRISDGFEISYVILCMGAACWIVYWLTKATGGVGGQAVAVEIPLRCEGCGYDLTHLPTQGVCTECGLDVRSSLTSGLRRPGCPWQASQDGGTWFQTTAGVLLSPAKFYGKLMLKGARREHLRFALWNYVGVGIWSAVSFIVLLIYLVWQHGGAPGGVVCGAPVIAMLTTSLGGWALHRIIGAACLSWAILKDTLPDVAWGRVVLSYESAYLWSFSLANTGFIFSVTIFDIFILVRDVFGELRFVAGLPIEPLMFLTMNAGLAVYWFWRYNLAFQRVRWSNF